MPQALLQVAITGRKRGPCE